MITGTYPFASQNPSSCDHPSFESRILLGERPHIPEDCLPDLKRLIERCWAHDPESRPTIDEVMHALESVGSKLNTAVSEAFDDLLEDMPPESRKIFEELQSRMLETEAELQVTKQSLQEALDMNKYVLLLLVSLLNF